MNISFTKSHTLLLVLLLSVGTVLAQNVYIPDANFKAALVATPSINTNGDGEIQTSEASAFTGTIRVSNKDIDDLTGIEAFTRVTSLWCDNNNLTSLNLSSNSALVALRCNHNQLTMLDVSSNVHLKDLQCYVNAITSLDVSNNPELVTLKAFQNQLTILDVSANTNLV